MVHELIALKTLFIHQRPLYVYMRCTANTQLPEASQSHNQSAIKRLIDSVGLEAERVVGREAERFTDNHLAIFKRIKVKPSIK